MIPNLHLCHFKLSHIKYLQAIELGMSGMASGFLTLHEPFNAWDKLDGYAGFVSSHLYFCGFYDEYVEKYTCQMDQRMAMLPLHAPSIDHSNKVCILDIINITFC
jgi:hypothetical protein